MPLRLGAPQLDTPRAMVVMDDSFRTSGASMAPEDQFALGEAGCEDSKTVLSTT